MNDLLTDDIKFLKEKVYNKCQLSISDFVIDKESKPYAACQFKLNELRIKSRHARITPKKVGQFVTFWKRNKDGITEPFNKTEPFEFLVVNVTNENRIGQFVFPKPILIAKKIMSNDKSSGKRGFRVYPIWDTTISKQAIKTQQWQLEYFIEFGTDFDKNHLIHLYHEF